MMKPILTAVSKEKEETKAVRELAEKLNPKSAKFNLVFCSPSFDHAKLGLAIKKDFGPNTIGCTTAGEICPEGFLQDSIVGMSLNGDQFEVDLITISDLRGMHEDSAQPLKNKFDSILNKQNKLLKDGKTFAILLIDGLSVREEEFTSLMEDVLRGVPLVGGSAGDHLKFESTLVYMDGSFHENAAVLAIVTTTLPFELFKIQHFAETDKRFVITKATPETRTVQEIEGVPAAEFYASQLGLEVSDLNPTIFSKTPVMLKIGGDYYVRSIQKMNEDLSLTFYCAIDTGLVLRMGKLKSIADTTREVFDKLSEKIGQEKHCIFFECVLRRLEIMELAPLEKEKILELYKKNNSIGFYTFGEQFGGVHINQTLTGVAAFGARTNRK
ncbi:MAG: FIST signal transduction protein [Bacteriovoracia bacterium]